MKSKTIDMTEGEALLELVKSMNAGGVGYIKDRVGSATNQLQYIKDYGYSFKYQEETR